MPALAGLGCKVTVEVAQVSFKISLLLAGIGSVFFLVAVL